MFSEFQGEIADFDQDEVRPVLFEENADPGKTVWVGMDSPEKKKY